MKWKKAPITGIPSLLLNRLVFDKVCKRFFWEIFFSCCKMCIETYWQKPSFGACVCFKRSVLLHCWLPFLFWRYYFVLFCDEILDSFIYSWSIVKANVRLFRTQKPNFFIRLNTIFCPFHSIRMSYICICVCLHFIIYVSFIWFWMLLNSVYCTHPT